MPDNTKILFVQKVNDTDFETEGLWCTGSGSNYIIDNIPFVAKRVSLGDVIVAEYDEGEKVYYFDDFVSVSGNTTVRIFFENEKLIEGARNILKEFGCDSEVFLKRKIVAVNVPYNTNYKPIKDYLEQGEKKGKWEYEESCLAHKY